MTWVRSSCVLAINVDPNTAALTITSDPLPTIIDGIPIQVKTVNVLIDRPDFVFNPTNCGPMSIGGSVTSREGSTATLQLAVPGHWLRGSRVQTAVRGLHLGENIESEGCEPDVRVSFRSGAQGAQANFAKVKIDLPKQLPSRLTTLQKACTAAIFKPTRRPVHRRPWIGVREGRSPRSLPVALAGPVYFVCHGGEAFPSLIFVLQGDGVGSISSATTFISKAGITSATLKTIPDAPFTSSN